MIPEEQVVSVQTLDSVVARPPGDLVVRLAAAIAAQRVIPTAAVDLVDRKVVDVAIAVQDVVARAAGELLPAKQLVLAGPADQDLAALPAAAVQEVLAVAAGDLVAAVPAMQLVVAVATADEVLPLLCLDDRRRVSCRRSRRCRRSVDVALAGPGDDRRLLAEALEAACAPPGRARRAAEAARSGISLRSVFISIPLVVVVERNIGLGRHLAGRTQVLVPRTRAVTMEP